MMKINALIASTALLTTLLLSACGGGDGDGNPVESNNTVASSTILSGTAASGAAIIGQVTVKGSLGNTTSALIEADGTYAVDVSGLTAPYRLRAQGTVGGRTIKLFSYAEAADVGGTVNITPFTDLIIANAAQQVAEAFFESVTTVELDPAVVDAQEAALQAKLQNVFDALGVSAAIDLLNSSFSADHSGLDAALDILRFEFDTGTNVATITNLIDKETVSDSILVDDDTGTLTVSDASTLTTAVTETQAIVAVFNALATAFAGGLPTAAAIEDFFSTDFYESDQSKGVLLTDITMDPNLIGLSFNSISVSDLDVTVGTAKVTFNFAINNVADLVPETWFVAKNGGTGLWQLRGDQQIADVYFNFHCNDNNFNSAAGSCGINTRFWDNDFTNNGTVSNAPIASGTVSIIDGSDGVTVKDVVYLGTPSFAAPGNVQVYDESTGNYSGDWKAFGTGLGEIDSSTFVAGDIIQYDLYTEALDVTTGGTSAPQIEAGAVPVATYTQTLLFAPSTTPLYPAATAATQTAIANFTLGTNLNVAWTLAAGTRNDEILVIISDSLGNRVEAWIETFGNTAISTTFASALLDSTAATPAGLDSTATSYNLLVRVYATDSLTDQDYSRDYTATIPGPAATPAPGGGGSTLACNTNSGWDDTADGGLGAPITPYSFADYEAVVADCGTAATIDYTSIAGKTFSDGDGETTIFDSATSAPTASSKGTGTFSDGVDTIPFNWYLESAGAYDYLVQEGSVDVLVNSVLTTVSFRDTSALTAVSGVLGTSGAGYTLKTYSEQSNYSTDSLTRATGTDGEIWTQTITQKFDGFSFDAATLAGVYEVVGTNNDGFAGTHQYTFTENGTVDIVYADGTADSEFWSVNSDGQLVFSGTIADVFTLTSGSQSSGNMDIVVDDADGSPVLNSTGTIERISALP